MLQTSEEAREYFKPLTYDILTEKNFNKLIAILEEHLGKWNRKVLEDRDKYGHDNRYYMSIHPHKIFSRYPGTRFIDKKYKEAFIIVKCDNYSIREGISFNKDGWIGFTGWSDNDNIKPFLSAFEEWVDLLKGPTAKFTIGTSIPMSVVDKHREAVYALLEKGVPMETSLDIVISEEQKITPEQAALLDTIKDKEHCLGLRILSTPAMTAKERKVWIDSYFVDVFPEDRPIGALIIKDGIEYIYDGKKWIKTF